MNLCELSQEQQRTVIQMQLQGNAFFEHLVSFAECRKTLDQSYKDWFKSDASRAIEEIGFGPDELSAADESAAAGVHQVELAMQAHAERAERAESAEMAADGTDPTGDEQIGSSSTELSDADFKHLLSWAKLREQINLNRKALATHAPRKLMVASQAELQALLARVQKESRKMIYAPYLQRRHAAMMAASKKGGPPALEALETCVLRHVPSPCTRAHIAEAMEKEQLDDAYDADMRESLVLLAMQRKLPAGAAVDVSLKRGSKAVPISAAALWPQVVQFTEERCVATGKLALRSPSRPPPLLPSLPPSFPYFPVPLNLCP